MADTASSGATVVTGTTGIAGTADATGSAGEATATGTTPAMPADVVVGRAVRRITGRFVVLVVLGFVLVVVGFVVRVTADAAPPAPDPPNVMGTDMAMERPTTSATLALR